MEFLLKVITTILALIGGIFLALKSGLLKGGDENVSKKVRGLSNNGLVNDTNKRLRRYKIDR